MRIGAKEKEPRTAAVEGCSHSAIKVVRRGGLGPKYLRLFFPPPSNLLPVNSIGRAQSEVSWQGLAVQDVQIYFDQSHGKGSGQRRIKNK